MEYKYDAETDVLMIVMSSEKPDFAEQRENIITHYSKEGKPIEIEIMDASKTMAELVGTILKSKRVVGS